MARRRHRGEGGQTSAEYLAVLLLVAALVVGVVSLTPDSVRDPIRSAVCVIQRNLGGECTAPDSQDDTVAVDDDVPASPPPPPACTVTAESWTSQTHTDWLFDRSVDGDRYQMTRLSDGTLVILDTGFTGGGGVIGGGVDLAVAELAASSADIRIEESGSMFVLDEEAFDAYQDAINALAVEAYTSGGPLADFGEALETGDFSDFQFKQMVREILVDQHVTHDFHRTSSQLEVTFDAAVPVPKTPILIGGGASSATTGSTAVAVERATGIRSITSEFTTEGEVGAFVSAYIAQLGGSSARASSTSFTTVVDADGEVTSAELTTRFEVDDNWLDGDLNLGIPGLPGSGLVADVFEVDDEGMVEMTFTVPVDAGDEAARAVDRFLRDPAANLEAFSAAAAEHGEVLGQTYTTESTTESGELALRALASAGIGFEDEHVSDRLTGAVSYDPVNGWLDRGDCS